MFLISKLESFQTEIKNQNNNMQTEITEIKNQINNMQTEIKNQINNMQTEIKNQNNNIQTEIQILKNIIQGKNAINSSVKAAGSLYIRDIFNNIYGSSGTLIEINSELFFATCKHCISASTKFTQYIFYIVQIKLIDGTQLIPEGSIYLFSSLKNNSIQTRLLDYALIKIQKKKDLTLRAAHIDNNSINLGTSIKTKIL